MSEKPWAEPTARELELLRPAYEELLERLSAASPLYLHQTLEQYRLEPIVKALRAARADALEEAARLVLMPYHCRECDRVLPEGVSPIDCDGRCSVDGMGAERLAAAIRALKDTSAA